LHLSKFKLRWAADPSDAGGIRGLCTRSTATTRIFAALNNVAVVLRFEMASAGIFDFIG
jgi:hypothetical protein